MLGDGGLGDAELAPDDVGDGAGEVLFTGEQLEDSSADGVAEDVKGVHQAGASGSPV